MGTVFNTFYLNKDFKFRRVDRENYEEGGNDKVNRTGSSPDGKYKLFIFETDTCIRGNNPTYCWKPEWRQLWLYSPQSEKTGKSKLEMLRKYQACVRPNVL